jgi:phosphatidylglycerophosphate synthase
MFDEPFRARFSRLARPCVRLLARRGVAANHVTVVAFILGMSAAALIAVGRTDIGLAVWLTSRIGDGLDGPLARETGGSTAFGGYLDITLDMSAYAAMVIGFAVLHPDLTAAWAAVLAGYVLVITTTLALSDAAGVLGRQVSGTNRTFQFTPGFTEAGETNVMYILWVVWPEHVWWLVWVWVAALAATGVQRTLLAWRVLRPGG